MTKPNIKQTTMEHLSALQKVLDETELFPSELLHAMFLDTGSPDSQALWLTGELEGSPVGFCYAIPEDMADGTWNMLALAVLPKVQGQGLGSALVAAAEDHLRNENQRLLIVDTSGTEDFKRTRAFYTQNGYEEEARIRDFWAAGDDKVTFRKSL
ncbi:MAG: GNAT family N-acetyltransferase [Pseudomonadota bacterium]